MKKWLLIIFLLSIGLETIGISHATQIKWDISKIEGRYLKLLKDANISPKITSLKDGKNYSIKNAYMTVTNSEASAIIIPVKSDVENAESMALIGVFIRVVCEKEEPNIGGLFINTFNRSLQTGTIEKLNTKSCSISIEPPNEKSIVPSITIALENK